jgi:phospholipase/lecithinase/hemolysin
MKTLIRNTRFAGASLLLALLAACGGGGGGGGNSGGNSGGDTPPVVKYQVVSFGDSLSDVGTYGPIASAVSGGMFTTNPGPIWMQNVAQYYGGTAIIPAYTIGFTQKLSPNGGLGYAEGGATVATPADQSAFLYALLGDVEMPVDQQVASYLKTYGSFNSGQLVFVWVGANDVLRAGTPPAALSTVETAATTLGQIVAQIVQAGATHVVVINLPNIGLTPKGLAQSDGGAAFNQLSVQFNTSLNAALQANGVANQVVMVDTYSWLNQMIANYQANGFTVSNTG